MMIESIKNIKNSLKDKVILLTGGANGIGFETAKALIYMGATVISADIDSIKGTGAQKYMSENFESADFEYYRIDLTKEEEIRKMHDYLICKYEFIDVIFNNAAMLCLGNVEDISMEDWDKCYNVNFKAPLLLTQLFLPEMRKVNKGTMIFVTSSGAAPYMGPYEVFKTCQAELCNTLFSELEDTEIYTYAIGPGLVKTETAVKSIGTIAKKMGMTLDEFYAMNESHILSAEEAGVGFALSILHANKYNGQEIGSVQVLSDSGVYDSKEKCKKSYEVENNVITLIKKIADIYSKQYEGWISLNIFERKWVLRDFKKTVGLSAEQFKIDMDSLNNKLYKNEDINIYGYINHFEKLKVYFERQYKLLQGFEKDPSKLKENSDILNSWVDMLDRIINGLKINL